jgi:hypothetical protein
VKAILVALMLVNAALFFFGALQHVGFTIGPFHEPRIIPAAIVETICGISLTTGAVITLTRNWLTFWSAPLFGNLVALAGVLLGIIALAAGRGPRTASNDLYHRIMLILIAVSIAVLVLYRLKRPVG